MAAKPPNERERLRQANRLGRQGQYQEAIRVIDGLYSPQAEELRTKLVARVRQQIAREVAGDEAPPT
ncbi:MAG: hypothetical protein AAF125_07250, partial [Chloroflexota bacterium]